MKRTTMKIENRKALAVIAALMFAAAPTFAKGKAPKHKLPKHYYDYEYCDTDECYEAKLIGTVKSIDEEAKTFVIANADGVESTVHVSPATWIEKNYHSRYTQPFSTIQIGDWVVIEKIYTNTETAEAKHVFIRSYVN